MSSVKDWSAVVDSVLLILEVKAVTKIFVTKPRNESSARRSHTMICVIKPTIPLLLRSDVAAELSLHTIMCGYC